MKMKTWPGDRVSWTKSGSAWLSKLHIVRIKPAEIDEIKLSRLKLAHKLKMEGRRNIAIRTSLALEDIIIRKW